MVGRNKIFFFGGGVLPCWECFLANKQSKTYLPLTLTLENVAIPHHHHHTHTQVYSICCADVIAKFTSSKEERKGPEQSLQAGEKVGFKSISNIIIYAQTTQPTFDSFWITDSLLFPLFISPPSFLLHAVRFFECLHSYRPAPPYLINCRLLLTDCRRHTHACTSSKPAFPSQLWP